MTRFNKVWLQPRRSHLSPWVTKFDRLKLIAQSSSPEHSHQLGTFSTKLVAFYKMIFFFQLSALFCLYKQLVYEQLTLGT